MTTVGNNTNSSDLMDEAFIFCTPAVLPDSSLFKERFNHKRQTCCVQQLEERQHYNETSIMKKGNDNDIKQKQQKDFTIYNLLVQTQRAPHYEINHYSLQLN